MLGVDEEDHIRSSVRLVFDNHEKAYEAKKILNDKLKSPSENLPVSSGYTWKLVVDISDPATRPYGSSVGQEQFEH